MATHLDVCADFADHLGLAEAIEVVVLDLEFDPDLHGDLAASFPLLKGGTRGEVRPPLGQKETAQISTVDSEFA